MTATPTQLSTADMPNGNGLQLRIAATVLRPRTTLHPCGVALRRSPIPAIKEQNEQKRSFIEALIGPKVA